MMLRPRRRTLVVFRQSAGLGSSYLAPKLAEPTPVRMRTHVGARLTVIGLMHLARGAKARWRPILAAATLTTAGVMLGSGGRSLLFFGGTWCLLHALLTPGRPDAERRRRCQLHRELAEYRTAAQQCDLAATFDRYPDGITCDLREMLATT